MEYTNATFQVQNRAKFQVQVSQQVVFSGRLVVQAFFRIVVDPIFDEGDFFRSRFLSSFR